MSDHREAKIRERAHTIWEREGRPEGCHDEHWHRACREVDEELAQASDAPAKNGAPPAAAPAAEAELEGTPKRRGRKPKAAGEEAGSGELFGQTPADQPSGSTSPAPRRGRKPKSAGMSAATEPAGGEGEAPAAAPKRGRPRKTPA